MKVKVCGMREPDNLQTLLQLPIDFVGFIFYDKSPRYVADDVLARWIQEKEEAFGNAKKVGVFVNSEIDAMLNRVHDYRLDFVQLQGEESPEYCQELSTFWQTGSVRSAQIIKAFGVGDDFDFGATAPYEPHCAYFLFDTKSRYYGGSGHRFNWETLDQYRGEKPFLLGGGIDEKAAPELRALQHPQFAGVDINSKFEFAPGLKDTKKVSRFLAELGMTNV